MGRVINAIVVHCAATPNGDKRFTLETLDSMHKQRGFQRQPENIAKYVSRTGNTLGSIGYHFVIQIDGTVRVGRDVEEIGAHVSGSNAKSIGICMIGTDKFTQAQWAALAGLVRGLQGQYPGASVKGHRDYSPDLDGDGVIEPQEWIKLCPGFDVASWLKRGMQPETAKVLT